MFCCSVEIPSKIIAWIFVKSLKRKLFQNCLFFCFLFRGCRIFYIANFNGLDSMLSFIPVYCCTCYNYVNAAETNLWESTISVYFTFRYENYEIKKKTTSFWRKKKISKRNEYDFWKKLGKIKSLLQKMKIVIFLSIFSPYFLKENFFISIIKLGREGGIMRHPCIMCQGMR